MVTNYQALKRLLLLGLGGLSGSSTTISDCLLLVKIGRDRGRSQVKA